MLRAGNKALHKARAKASMPDREEAMFRGISKATIKVNMSATTRVNTLAILEAIAGGVVAGAMLGGTFMYLGHEALDPDGLSQVTEETESISTEMEMSDDEFAPGEPVEDEDWYERHRAEWDGDETYARSHEGFSGHGDENFYEGGGYIGGGYEGSDGYDTNQDVRDDSQVHLSQEYEADRGGFAGDDKKDNGSGCVIM
ncbi:hypothetical protein NW754_002712 [Fusarium falciforme]|nr:hypothetical protein NW754_002712 [Fusarium falciforme]